MHKFDQYYEFSHGGTTVSYAIRGKNFGNYRGTSEGGTERIVDMAKAMGVKKVIRPKLKFTNVIHMPAQPLELQQTIEGVALLGTPEHADGVLVSEKNVGVFIANADCPILTLFAGGSMVVCHAGLECLLHERSIIDSAFDALGAHFYNAFRYPATGFLAFGAGPCCYGMNMDNVIHDRIAKRFEHGTTVVEHGSRSGQRAVDLADLCRQNCEKSPCRAFHGTPHSFRGLHVVSECTSCAGLPVPTIHGYGDYFSNLRDDKANPGLERNGVMVVLK